MKLNGEDVISMKPQSKLKVAHFAKFAPNQAGISGTAIDMVMAERLVGIDAQLIDYAGSEKPSIVGQTSNGVTTVGPSWAEKADILVRHSAIPQRLENLGKPLVQSMHGRPEYMFRLDYINKLKIIGEYKRLAADSRYKAAITFWREHLDFLNMLLPDTKIDYVPAMVNLEVFKPTGIRLDYDTDGGKPNILITDMFREDVSPFNVLLAGAMFIRKYCPEGRIHIYGLQRTKESPVKDIIEMMKTANILSQAEPLTKNMHQIYRAADMLITPHRIATRVIREALASGVPIVAGEGCPYTEYTADARYTEGFAAKIDECWNDIKDNREVASIEARGVAEKNFNLKQAGEAALKVYERVMKQPKPIIELRTKPMIYNFIAFATEAEDGGKDLGAAYNRYMKLLPKDDDWACFIDHDAMPMTVNWYKQLENILIAHPEYSLLTACTNRIGNPQQKISGLEDTHDIMYHRNIGERLQIQGGTDVMDVTDSHCISGVLMLVKKSVWKKAGGFKSGFLGIDNKFHISVKEAGGKVGVMRGLYLYHFYRADDKGLQPVSI